MQTNNTTPISTVYTVITYAVFGTIQTTVAFYSKEDAEKNVIDWANDNSYKGAAFTSADEAINWFVDADEDIEVSIRLEETYVYGNKTYYDDDLEMLTSENKFMGEFLSKLGYSQDEVSEIANTGMLETPKNDEITTVVKLKNGILDEVKSFVSHKDAEAFFQEEVVKLEPSLSKEDIEACLDNGYWDNNSGDDIFITQNDLVGIGSNNVSCESNEVLEPECQIKTLADAKALIGERVDVIENDETSEFNGLVIDASYNDIDGILITVLDQDDKAWDIEPKFIHSLVLSAVYPKVGMQVCVGGYDDNASAGQQRFVDEHYGQLFEVLEVGEYSSKLRNVPFHVKHAHVYEIVKQGEGK